MKINLVLLVLGAVIGSIGFRDTAYKQYAHIISAIIFFSAMGVTVLLAFKRWEKTWYAGRAVAESAKSLAWKYVCAADPFPIDLTKKDVDERFTLALSELLKENKHLALVLSNSDSNGEQITEIMRELRLEAVGDRRDAYLAQRINDQQHWYKTKSAANRRSRNIWFVLLLVFQLGASTAAILLAVYPDFSWRATAVLGTLASATVAWGTMMRYQELAQSYGLAALELSLIAERGRHVETTEELARFVNDAETAISREHSMWVARRETK